MKLTYKPRRGHLPDESGEHRRTLRTLSALPVITPEKGMGGREGAVEGFRMIFYIMVHCLTFCIKNKLMHCFLN